MDVSGKNIIGFDFSSESDITFRPFFSLKNSFSEFQFVETTENEVNLAFQKTKIAFEIYKTYTGEQKANLFEKIIEKIKENEAILHHYFCLESALPLERAISELNRTTFTLQHFAEFLKENKNFNFYTEEAQDDRKPIPKPKFEKKLIPIGPVVVFSASNFPFAYSTIGGDTISALAAGCPVIVKSHPYHPITGDLMGQIVMKSLKELHFPDGTFSNLNASGTDLGMLLVKHPICKAVGFTGSKKGGLAIFKSIQEREEPIPFFAEMGSVNPIFIFHSAIEDETITDKIAKSISLHAGQFCTNPGLIFYFESELAEKFKKDLVSHLEKVPPQIMVHPNIRSNFKKAAENLISKNKTKILINKNDWLGTDVFPIIHDMKLNDFLQEEEFQEEVFGMHTILISCKKQTDFQKVANALKGQLTCSLFIQKEELSVNQAFISSLENIAGRIILNGVPTGVEVTKAMHHGGPFPATTDSRFTAVGQDAIYRFLRPVSYQNFNFKF